MTDTTKSVVYFIYEIKPTKALIQMKPSIQDLEEDFKKFFLKNIKSKNLIYPTRNGHVFVTIDSNDANTIPNQIKTDLYELNKIPYEKEIQKVKHLFRVM